MIGALRRTGRSILCGAAFMAAAPAMACLPANPSEFMFSSVTLAARFWLASLLLGGLILCLDLYEKRLSFALPLAGWVVFASGLVIYQHPAWRGGRFGYSSDCTVPIIEVSQYVLALVSALFAYRIFQSLRSN